MNKTLYLMRHGKAEKTLGVKDFDRRLLDDGMRDVRRQARHVFKEDIPSRFAVSSAVRTTQTALHIREELGFSEDRIDYYDSLYLCSIRELLQCVNQFDDLWATVCVIGHNPSINYLAEYLTNSEIDHIETSGIVKITYEGRWAELTQESADLDFYQPLEI